MSEVLDPPTLKGVGGASRIGPGQKVINQLLILTGADFNCTCPDLWNYPPNIICLTVILIELLRFHQLIVLNVMT